MPDILIRLIIGLLFWAAFGFLILTVYLPVHVLSRLLDCIAQCIEKTD